MNSDCNMCEIAARECKNAIWCSTAMEADKGIMKYIPGSKFGCVKEKISREWWKNDSGIKLKELLPLIGTQGFRVVEIRENWTISDILYSNNDSDFEIYEKYLDYFVAGVELWKEPEICFKICVIDSLVL